MRTQIKFCQESKLKTNKQETTRFVTKEDYVFCIQRLNKVVAWYFSWKLNNLTKFI